MFEKVTLIFYRRKDGKSADEMELESISAVKADSRETARNKERS